MEAARRATRRETWLSDTLASLQRREVAERVALAAEASTRRFSRIATDAGPLVLMDAPPETENNAAFLALANWLRRHGLHAPEVVADGAARGFFLLEDLGDRSLAAALVAADAAERQRLYRLALTTLVQIQHAGQQDPPPLPRYDRARLERELGLFREWFVKALLALQLPTDLWQQSAAALTDVSLAQPRACVYLDYHSRNLLLLDGDTRLGLVDFQDMHHGPVCYDVVSLLRDCYQRWPEEEVRSLRADYLEEARAAGIRGLDDAAVFARAFDLCGIQRHLKALGIFARVALTRGQRHYLDDMPRVLEHLLTVAPGHPETAALARWLEAEVLPALAPALARLEAER